MATHSSVLAWRIPGIGSLVDCHYGVTQSRTRLKRLSNSSSSSTSLGTGDLSCAIWKNIHLQVFLNPQAVLFHYCCCSFQVEKSGLLGGGFLPTVWILWTAGNQYCPAGPPVLCISFRLVGGLIRLRPWVLLCPLGDTRGWLALFSWCSVPRPINLVGVVKFWFQDSVFIYYLPSFYKEPCPSSV